MFSERIYKAQSKIITLDKELSQVRAYLSLEQARYPGRFNYQY
ncbi:histidine kinase [Staphylococcus aureus]